MPKTQRRTEYIVSPSSNIEPNLAELSDGWIASDARQDMHNSVSLLSCHRKHQDLTEPQNLETQFRLRLNIRGTVQYMTIFNKMADDRVTGPPRGCHDSPHPLGMHATLSRADEPDEQGRSNDLAEKKRQRKKKALKLQAQPNDAKKPRITEPGVPSWSHTSKSLPCNEGHTRFQRLRRTLGDHEGRLEIQPRPFQELRLFQPH